MNQTSKNLKNNYFILYDNKDNLIYYFENGNELSKKLNKNFWRITENFKKTTENFIKIIIEKKEYKLYTYTD